jgi:hypothetical protein
MSNMTFLIPFINVKFVTNDYPYFVCNLVSPLVFNPINTLYHLEFYDTNDLHNIYVFDLIVLNSHLLLSLLSHDCL